MLNAKRPAMIGLSLWKSWTAAMYRSAVDYFAAAMIINTIYVYILNVMRLFNDCIIIVSDLNRWYVPKCCQNFGGFDSRCNLSSDVECWEALQWLLSYFERFESLLCPEVLSNFWRQQWWIWSTFIYWMRRGLRGMRHYCQRRESLLYPEVL